ncbi:MAG: RNA polymerase sigma factor [Sandaracinus sp.]|nr:RNA polymerase sigma factor [Sandaracinus sp.]
MLGKTLALALVPLAASWIRVAVDDRCGGRLPRRRRTGQCLFEEVGERDPHRGPRIPGSDLRPGVLGFASVDAPRTSLVDRLRAGEPAAVAEAYDTHGAAVLAFSRRLVGDPAAAQDLTQEVFLTLPKVARRFEERASLRSFLLSIAVNHARHHVRAASRRRAAMERFAHEPEGSHESPDQRLARRQLADALQRALDELPLDQRVAFVLCEVEERTSVEVAEIVGAPEATVRTRLFHAKRKLRESLAKEGVR